MGRFLQRTAPGGTAGRNGCRSGWNSRNRPSPIWPCQSAGWAL